ncbi:MAG TPA: ATP-binding protein, partial [Candidatus Omnitrophota bacterium]|nr:ATP-binding protein [Candidatus Omnitrophota bacterium]
LAHELNQPLLATIAFTRAAQRLLAGDSPDRDKAGGALDRAVAEAQRAGEIVRTLREFIGTGMTDRSANSLADMVADAAALVTPEAARRGLRMVVAVDKSLPAVHVDRVQVQQVLLNLVRNAMDAVTDHAPPREVAVQAWPEDGAVVVEVRDTGPGIADEVAERLFQPFNTSKASGMGLGLSISRSIVEAHGGRLWLAANGPQGAAFRFTLLKCETGDHA